MNGSPATEASSGARTGPCESKNLPVPPLLTGQDARELALPGLEGSRLLLEMIVDLIRLRESSLPVAKHRVDRLSREAESSNPRGHGPPKVVRPQVGQTRPFPWRLILGASPFPEAIGAPCREHCA